MKKLLLLACMAISVMANAQDFPQPSPLAKSYQMVGLTEMEIEYSSPGVKGREIFGNIVPFNELWRTGANMATIITFSEPATIGESKIPAGSYALFSYPMEDKITFILNTNTDQGGTGSYDQSLDVATITVDFNKTKNSVERLMFSFENTNNMGTELRMSWENRTCVMPITVDTEAVVNKRYEAKMKEFDNEYSFYHSAASYYLEMEDYNKAMDFGKKSVSMKKKFWNTHVYALALQAGGANDLALKMAKESLKLSEEAKYEPYIKKNQVLIAELEK